MNKLSDFVFLRGQTPLKKAPPIYVETTIKTEMERIWEATQNPNQHELWDLRFSNIHYLPKEHEEAPQRFLYKTNIGFGLSIAGEGESVGTLMKKSGERTSSLKFSTDNPFSLIQKGRGYWKYVPTESGIQFLTQYDYETRFGFIGKLGDRFLFRPLMGWATAWSFDSLRLWLEKGIHPSTSKRCSVMHALICVILAFLWIYQGLVPKLLFPDSGEMEMLQGTGLFSGYEEILLAGVGLLEIAFGLTFLLPIRKQRLFLLNITALIFLPIGAVISDPMVFMAPFNPISLNLSMIGLALIGMINVKDLPSARHCKRKR